MISREKARMAIRIVEYKINLVDLNGQLKNDEITYAEYERQVKKIKRKIIKLELKNG